MLVINGIEDANGTWTLWFSPQTATKSTYYLVCNNLKCLFIGIQLKLQRSNHGNQTMQGLAFANWLMLAAALAACTVD